MSKQVDLCRAIYREHKTAVDYLVSHEMMKDPVESDTIYEIVRKYKEVANYIKQFGEIDAFQMAMQGFIQLHPELIACGSIGRTSQWCYPKAYDSVENSQHGGLRERLLLVMRRQEQAAAQNGCLFFVSRH